MNISIAQAFSKSAKQYDRHAKLQRQVTDELFARISPPIENSTRLDLGNGTGYAHPLLANKNQKVIGLDIAYQMCRHYHDTYPDACSINADMEAIPLQSSSIDHVFSSMSVHWCSLDNVFAEIHRILKPKGSFAVSIVSDGSLYELSNTLTELGFDKQINNFPTINAIENALPNTQWECVWQTQTIVEHYTHIIDILRNIKAIGASTKLQATTRYPGKHFYNEANTLYHNQYGSSDKTIPLTWKVHYITGKKL
jgi:malonyl-CoA O-methyltransferase